MKQIFINGFGRIGRCILRVMFEDFEDFEVIGINDPQINIENAIYLLKYDSIYGAFKANVYRMDNKIVIKNTTKKWVISFYQQNVLTLINTEPETIVIEASNMSDLNILGSHKRFKRVYLTRWSDKADKVLFLGKENICRNDNDYLISCGVCDIIGLVPILSVFENQLVDDIIITTIHPCLNYQNVLDGSPCQLNEFCQLQSGRSVFNSVIPRKSSVQKILLAIFPEFNGKLSFETYRVPTDIVTTCNIYIRLNNTVSRDFIIEKIKSINSFIRICNDYPLVSRDFIDSKDALSIDLNYLSVEEESIRFTLWYNNEIGYAATICKLIYDEENK